MRIVGSILCVAALAVATTAASTGPEAQRSGAQQPPPTQAPPAQQTPATPTATPAAPPNDYGFPSGAGLLFFYVKPDKAQDFEGVVAKINEVLSKSQDPGRRQQAANWKIYKSTETPKEGTIYVFFFDPAVVGADYDPIKLLGEGLPAEVQGLYDRLKEALIRVERMGLTKIR